jgi:hypothetical protein
MSIAASCLESSLKFQVPKPPPVISLPGSCWPSQLSLWVRVAAPRPTTRPFETSSFRWVGSAATSAVISARVACFGSTGWEGNCEMNSLAAADTGSAESDSSTFSGSILALITLCWLPAVPRSFRTRVSSVLNESLAKTSLTRSSFTAPSSRSPRENSNSRSRSRWFSLRLRTASSLCSLRLSPTLPGI